MKQQHTFIFWTEYESEEHAQWLGQELREGRLRQGWGAKGMSLFDRSGDLLDPTAWQQQYVAAHRDAEWDQADRTETSVRSRHRILARMLKIQRGDLLVIPRKPERDEIALARAQGNYKFSIAPGKSDFGHIIHIDKQSLRIVAYNSPVADKLISRFSNYRAAINSVLNEDFADSIHGLYESLGNSIRPSTENNEDHQHVDTDNTLPGRAITAVERIIRDTAKGRELKKLYGYKCQVCGTGIPIPGSDVPYVEVHHLVALGKQAMGNDDWNNMLVVCPNCHTAFDYGAYRIHPKTLSVHTPNFQKKIEFHAIHRLSEFNLKRHWRLSKRDA